MAGHALLVYADPTTLSAPTATVKNCAMDVLRNEEDISMNSVTVQSFCILCINHSSRQQAAFRSPRKNWESRGELYLNSLNSLSSSHTTSRYSISAGKVLWNSRGREGGRDPPRSAGIALTVNPVLTEEILDQKRVATFCRRLVGVARRAARDRDLRLATRR